jgi:hypothetical protein
MLIKKQNKSEVFLVLFLMKMRIMRSNYVGVSECLILEAAPVWLTLCWML